tara:strand:- start:299 stop:1615 length:1317 start_codon:yes stop_codon:yes gene_type:complete
MFRILLIFSFISFIIPSNSIVNSGPMVGYSTKSEVALWIQTKKSSKVKFIYWDINESSNIFETEEIITSKNSGFTATLIADLVKPGTIYQYQPIIDNQKIEFDYKLEFQTQKHWEYRTSPPNFSFAVGSCAYTNEIEKDRPGKSYGGDYFIYSNILEKNPDFMLWLGDNVYFREPDNSKTGVYHRYSHDRSLKELQPLLGSVHHYAIWDDHDYGPNNSDRSFIYKNITLQAFKDFWANPTYGVGNNKGITTQFSWSDVEFFLLDNRFFRSPQNREHTYREILGKEQLQWLIDALSSSQATFKIIAIGGQVLNSEKVYENYINWEEEHTELLNLIEKEKIDGVIFLSGDRHFSEVSKMPRFNSYPLHDFTVSPLTSGFCDICIDENNKYRMKESAVFQRNFAIFSIYSSNKDRVLDYTIFDNKGNPLWNYKINASDLKY